MSRDYKFANHVFDSFSFQVVAVKKLDRTGMQGSREFCAEVIMLSLVQHPNLVNLVGYCAEGDQRILVYDFLANGSLENHLLGMHTFYFCCIYMLFLE